MTVHPVSSSDAPALRTQQRPDSVQAGETSGQAPDSAAYDTAWTESRTELPRSTPDRFEAVMTADGKIYVVVAVVLIIWLGLLAFIFRTDRRIDTLERRMGPDISEDDDAGRSNEPPETGALSG